jgi:hypothetical protein
MYNPNYLERPYIVVLNKIDLPEVCACDYSFRFGSPALNINPDFPNAIIMHSYKM